MRHLPKAKKRGVTVVGALLRLVLHPNEYLIKKWNWKSAILSTILRSALFFFTNLTAGLPAAFAALATEWVYRGITSGFYGAVTEALSGGAFAQAAGDTQRSSALRLSGWLLIKSFKKENGFGSSKSW